jgi:non-canonical poly(A) RNA polymerase PAPD5/7
MAYSDKVNVLNSLANTLRKAGVTERVSIIGKAKVPIIKFVTTHGHFAVDISINQMNGVSAGQMVNNYIRALPALRAVVLVVKSFLSQRSMNEVFTGGLGSYSVVCLAVSFLQQHPKIRRGEMDPTKNLGVLVMEFFEFYGIHYNYTDVGISLRDGGTYYNKFRRGWADYKQPGLLSIEDPADPCTFTCHACLQCQPLTRISQQTTFLEAHTALPVYDKHLREHTRS